MRVFFGATVTYTILPASLRSDEAPASSAQATEHVVRIVGLDEVDLDRRHISWMSPLARALMKSSPGDRVVLRAPGKTEHLEVLDVEYAPIAVEPFREPPGAESASSGRRSTRS
jgi:transcription elongation factor GreB